VKKGNKIEKIKKKIVKDFNETLDVFSVSVPCIICGREEECPLSEMPVKKIFGLYPSSQYVCEICKEEFLKDGVCIISEDHSRHIIITDDAFRRLFEIEIPRDRVMYIDKDTIDELEKNIS